MYKRKIEEYLVAWKNKDKRKPLIIKGVRQCGKTSSVRNFAEKHYEHVIYLNFHEKKSFKAFFNGDLDVFALSIHEILDTEIKLVLIYVNVADVIDFQRVPLKWIGVFRILVPVPIIFRQRR